jgi:hypothetical protein
LYINRAGVFSALSFNGSTGAATFSSSVAVGGSNISYSAANRGNITLNGTSGIIGFNNSGTAMGYFFHDGTNMQMWNELSGSLIFGNSATTRMTIDASGILGLGVTPSAWRSADRALQINDTSGGNTGSFHSVGGTVGINTNSYFGSIGGASWKYYGTGAAAIYWQEVGSHRWGIAGSGTAGNAISFTQAMTLTAGGNLLVNTTTDAGYKLDVNGTGRFSGNVGIGSVLTTLPTTLTVKGNSIGDGIGKASFLGGGDENTWTALRNEVIRIGRGDIPSAYYHSIWSATGGSTDETLHWLKFYISNTGGSNQTLALTLNGYGDAIIGRNVTASAFFESSDKRLKKEISDNSIIDGIEAVKSKLYIKDGKRELGYYAQDLQEILPSAVSEGEDGFLSLSYSQVHTAKIAHLEAEVAELKELIKSLKIN